MTPSTPDYAAPPVMVRYLAVFHRAFVAINLYTQNGDRAGMLVGGYLASALHNVPAMLWNCSNNKWLTPKHIDELVRTFPENMAEKGAPEHIVEDCHHIVSSQNSARELGIKQDLSDVILAPMPKMYEYLNSLYQACLLMRLMKSHGNRPSPAWENLEAIWSDQAQEKAESNAQVAVALAPIPKALLVWNNFDEDTFLDAAVENRMAQEILFLSHQVSSNQYPRHDRE